MRKTKYEPFGILPNVSLDDAIDGGQMVLAPFGHALLDGVRLQSPAFGEFLSRFTDAFGHRVKPSVILRSQDASKSFQNSDARSRFRDLIALSIIPYGWAQKLRDEVGPDTVWGDYFSVYAWSLSSDTDLLVGRTPAATGLDELSRFRGQCSSDLFPQNVPIIWVDKPLLGALMQQWKAVHKPRAKPAWQQVALFRSLNMALRASRMPAGRDISEYDVGASIALWVSAFEILAHPGPGGDVGLSKVYELLEKAPWRLPESKAARYLTYVGRRRARSRKCNACWIYGELYRARCDFLHGNPVGTDSLVAKRSRRPLYQFAAPLYRMALASFLDLRFSQPEPSQSDTKRYVAYAQQRALFLIFQGAYERALLEVWKRRNQQA